MNNQQLTWLQANIKPLLAIIIVLLSFGYFFLLAFGLGKSSNDQVLIAIVGILAGATGYYFGSSSGSTRKDEALVQGNNNTTVTTPSSAGQTS